jgi:hypothetical protein
MMPQLYGVNDLIEMSTDASHHVLVLPVLSQEPFNFTCNSKHLGTLLLQ